MKIAFAGKGGVGKTSLAAWTADYLARQGHDVWCLDADTALSLGQALGLGSAALPVPLIEREDLVRQRIGSGCLHLNPAVEDLPAALAVTLPPTEPRAGQLRLLVMGGPTTAGGGCACAASALLKAVIAHLVLEPGAWVVVDLEAGVEHLGRGTAAHVDGLVVVSEPSRRSLETAAQVGTMATELGVGRQVLVLNRASAPAVPELLSLPGLPSHRLAMPRWPGLEARQLADGGVLGLPEQTAIDALVAEMLTALQTRGVG